MKKVFLTLVIASFFSLMSCESEPIEIQQENIVNEGNITQDSTETSGQGGSLPIKPPRN